MNKTVTIVSTSEVLKFEGIDGWVLKNVHKNGSRVYSEFGNFHCSELDNEIEFMLKTDSESILVHTYHKHIVDLIIQKCISKNIKVEFIRLETHYDGDLQIIEDIEDVLACGMEIM